MNLHRARSTQQDGTAGNIVAARNSEQIVGDVRRTSPVLRGAGEHDLSKFQCGSGNVLIHVSSRSEGVEGVQCIRLCRPSPTA